VTGTGPFTYQWLKNGVAIAGATGSTFTIVSVDATSAANYTVRVTGPGGAVTSLPGTLSLQAAPAITAQPGSQFKALGQSAIFSLTATGTGPLTYQWSKDGNPIPGATGASLAIASVSAADEGEYQVSVANAVGAVVSQAARLTLVTAPTIVEPPATIVSVQAPGARVYRSKWFSFNAGAETWSVVPWSGRWDEMPAVGWFWNDQGDEAGVNYSSLEAAEGGGTVRSPLISLAGLSSPELRLYASSGPGSVISVAVSLDGTSWVTLHSAVTSSSYESPLVLSLAAYAGKSIYIRVISSGSALMDDVSIWGYGTAKESAELSIKATGSGLTYQWFKNGIAVTGATSRTLMIADVYASGSYSVVVTNAAGSVTSAATTVGVSPSITSQPASLSRLQGQAAVFSVVATGTGPLSYQWSRNGLPIAGATGSSYSIASVTSSSAGTYTVTVTGAVGQVLSQGAELSVVMPPSITSQPASISVQGPYFATTTLRNYTFDAGAEGWSYGSNVGDWSPYDWAWDGSAGSLTDRLSGSAYSNNTDTYVQSPWISTLGIWSPVLSFYLYHDLYNDWADRLEVQASGDGFSWSTLRSIYGYGSQVYSVYLDAYQLSGFYLRYRLKTDSFGGAYGVEVRNSVVAGSYLVSGQAASFTVSLASAAGCSFQWYKNGLPVSGATSASLSIPSVVSGDAGMYKVIVTNAAGSVSSAEASLTVL
jgi:hypothetical protein